MGDWHHFAGTYDGTELCIYIDGQQIAKANRSVGGKIDSSKNPVVIGRDNRDVYLTARTMDCILDEARIWNRVLNGNEIKEAMSGALIAVNPQDLLTTVWGKVKTGF